MSDDEFNKLVNGPLYHPITPLMINRVILALRIVVDAAGEQGEQALRAYCEERQMRDETM